MSSTITPPPTGPPKKEDLTLMAMPAEILAAILDQTLAGQVLLERRMEAQEFRWSHSWVWKLLLVSKSFSPYAREAIVNNAILSVKEMTRDKNIMESNYEPNERCERHLELSGFPEYVQRKAKFVDVQQLKTLMMMKTDRIILDQLPNLRLIVIKPGPMKSMLTALATQLIFSMTRSNWREASSKLLRFKQALTDFTDIKDRQKLLTALTAQTTRLMNPSANRDNVMAMFGESVSCCISSSQTSAEKFFSFVTQEMLGITRDSFESLDPDTAVVVSFPMEGQGQVLEVGKLD